MEVPKIWLSGITNKTAEWFQKWRCRYIEQIKCYLLSFRQLELRTLSLHFHYWVHTSQVCVEGIIYISCHVTPHRPIQCWSDFMNLYWYQYSCNLLIKLIQTFKITPQDKFHMVNGLTFSLLISHLTSDFMGGMGSVWPIVFNNLK